MKSKRLKSFSNKKNVKQCLRRDFRVNQPYLHFAGSEENYFHGFFTIPGNALLEARMT